MHNLKETICIKLIAFVTLLLSFWPSNLIFAQEDHQVWVNYTLKASISEQLHYGGDIGYRTSVMNTNWSQLVFRPAITYQFKKPMSVAGAIAWFGTFNKSNYNINEFRIHQDFNAKWPELGFIDFFYRLRVEQRFFFYQDPVQNDQRLRIRGLIGIETRDLAWFGLQNPIYFQSIFEGFQTIDNKEAVEYFINQSRLHFAVGQRFSDKIRFELHYMRQGSILLVTEGPKTIQNIYRIRFFHTLGGH